MLDLESTVLRGLPADRYHAIDRCSNSRLNLIARAPLHLRHELDNPRPAATCIKRSDALEFGGLLHAMAIECEGEDLATELETRYQRMPSFRTAAGGTAFKEKTAWLETCASMAATPVEADAWDAAAAMRKSLLANQMVRALLKATPREDRELTVLFEEPSFLEPCKMRIDLLCRQYRCVVDLKTTQDASIAAFQRSISAFGYHRQAGFYLQGLPAAGIGGIDYFYNIAIEKEPPHAVAVYQMVPEAIQQGEAELQPLISTYQACRLSGDWSGGYAPRNHDPALPIPINLPRWHYAQWENGNA
jgi:hypothetical protein